jgi:hypothetical protein
MAGANMVLEYSVKNIPRLDGMKIRLYDDGRLEQLETGTDPKTMESVDGKVLRELKVAPDLARIFCNRLIEAGIYSCRPEPGSGFVGVMESMTMNYQGLSLKISSGNQKTYSLFPEIVQDMKGFFRLLD